MITYNKLKPAPLLHDNWKHIDKRSLEEYRADDWKILITQKRQYLAERQADEVLRMLKIQATDPSYGYTVNIYQHCLQTAVCKQC
jgi:hypothetical protein